MSWIQTYTGRKFDPLKARAEDVDIRDIAHALSLICRFNGHCRQFYSVAEHSIYVAHLLPSELRLWGLLHDAAEAYLGDIVQPLKLQLNFNVSTSLQEVERRLMKIIAERFGLAWPEPPGVKHADLVMLATEARDLMGPPPEPWSQSLPGPRSSRIDRVYWPDAAEQSFLAVFEALTQQSTKGACATCS